MGDLPFPVKSKNPTLKACIDEGEKDALESMCVVLPELTPEEKRRVKICDLLEMNEFGREELARGNSFAWPIVYDTNAALSGMLEISYPQEWLKVKAHIESINWME